MTLRLIQVLKPKTKISFCQWNLNGLAAHSFTEVSLLQALSVTHDYDIVCLSKTFLDSFISNDKRINNKGYNLLQADHQSNKKKEEALVCIIIIRNTFLSLKEMYLI